MNRPRRSWTLVELLLALSLAGLVATILGSVALWTARVAGSVPGRTLAEAMADAVEERLREDLRHTVGLGDARPGKLELHTRYLDGKSPAVTRVLYELEDGSLYRSVAGDRRLFATGVLSFAVTEGAWDLEDQFDTGIIETTVWWPLPFTKVEESGGLLRARGVRVGETSWAVSGVGSQAAFERDGAEIETRFMTTTTMGAGIMAFSWGSRNPPNTPEGLKVFISSSGALLAGYSGPLRYTNELETVLANLGNLTVDRWYTLRLVAGKTRATFWMDRGSGLEIVHESTVGPAGAYRLWLLSATSSPEARWDLVRIRNTLAVEVEARFGERPENAIARRIRGKVRHE